MDELDGGRLDAERLRGGVGCGLKEGASEEELEGQWKVGCPKMMTIEGSEDVQASRRDAPGLILVDGSVPSAPVPPKQR